METIRESACKVLNSYKNIDWGSDYNYETTHNLFKSALKDLESNINSSSIFNDIYIEIQNVFFFNGLLVPDHIYDIMDIIWYKCLNEDERKKINLNRSFPKQNCESSQQLSAACLPKEK